MEGKVSSFTKQKVCPFLMNNSDSPTNSCQGNLCAWWIIEGDEDDVDYGRCAMLAIGITLENIRNDNI